MTTHAKHKGFYRAVAWCPLPWDPGGKNFNKSSFLGSSDFGVNSGVFGREQMELEFKRGHCKTYQ